MPNLLKFPAGAAFLFAAIILYALLGTPTPDNPGLAEAIIGALLILSLLCAPMENLSPFGPRNSFLAAMQVFWIAGLILPTLAGVYHGHAPALILRDLAAFAFLGLPLFLSESIARDGGAAIVLRALCVFAGIMFAGRTLLPAFNVWVPEGELLYLSNSPLSLFAAIFLGCTFFDSLATVRRNFFKALLCLAALCVILSAMLLDVQRATVGAVFLSLAALMAVRLFETPRIYAAAVAVIAGVCIAAFPLLADAFGAIAQKTAAVGWNMRAAEAQAVYEAVANAPDHLILGQGWGATFSSPAVGGLHVNYTHSLLTTMLLKGGIIMAILAAIAMISGLYQIFLIFQRDRVMALALVWPLLIPVLLYASHKSLDFGLVLLLIVVWSVRARTLPEARGSDKNF